MTELRIDPRPLAYRSTPQERGKNLPGDLAEGKQARAPGGAAQARPLLCASGDRSFPLLAAPRFPVRDATGATSVSWRDARHGVMSC